MLQNPTTFLHIIDYIKCWPNLKKFYLIFYIFKFPTSVFSTTLTHIIFIVVFYSCLATSKKALAFLFPKDSVVSCMTLIQVNVTHRVP